MSGNNLPCVHPSIFGCVWHLKLDKPHIFAWLLCQSWIAINSTWVGQTGLLYNGQTNSWEIIVGTQIFT